MCEIQYDSESLTFLHQLTSKSCQAGGGRAAGGKDPASGGRVFPRMGERNGAQSQLVKDVQQVKIVAQGLGPFHREEKRYSTCDPGLFDLRKCLAKRESR